MTLLFDETLIADNAPPITNWLVAPEIMPADAMQMIEDAMRECWDHKLANMVVFTDEENQIANAGLFQAAMKANRLPTTTEALAWLERRRANVGRARDRALALFAKRGTTARPVTEFPFKQG